MPDRANPFSPSFFIWKWKPPLLAALWFIGMAILLLLPSSELKGPDVQIDYIDKIAHVILFAGMAFLGIRAIDSVTNNIKKFLLNCTILIICIVLFGLLVEHLQENYLNRDGNLPDFIADLIGVGLGTVIGMRKYR